MLRTVLAVCASMALTTAVVTNAWLQKKQFYPTVVHLTRSNQSMLILYVQAQVAIILLQGDLPLLQNFFWRFDRPLNLEAGDFKIDICITNFVTIYVYYKFCNHSPGVCTRFSAGEVVGKSFLWKFASSRGRELDGTNLVRHYRHLPRFHHVPR